MLLEPPQNGQYLVAAYVLTPVILWGYWLVLLRRAGQEKREGDSQDKKA